MTGISFKDTLNARLQLVKMSNVKIRYRARYRNRRVSRSRFSRPSVVFRFSRIEAYGECVGVQTPRRFRLVRGVDRRYSEETTARPLYLLVWPLEKDPILRRTTRVPSTIVTPALHTLEPDNAWVKRYYVRAFTTASRAIRNSAGVKAEINQRSVITGLS